MDYKEKYFKYKLKYNNLKLQLQSVNKLNNQYAGNLSLTIDTLINGKAPTRKLEKEFQDYLKEQESKYNTILSKFNDNGDYKEDQEDTGFATLFCDYYKWSMSPIFILVTKHLNTNSKKAIVTLGVDFRDKEVKELLISNEELRKKIIENLHIFSRRTFNKALFMDLIEKKLLQSRNDLLSPPVAELALTESDVNYIVLDSSGNPRTLAQPNICLEKYIPGVTPNYDINDVVISCYIHEEQFYVEATGPWPHVTWLETSMMQNVYQTITAFKRTVEYREWLYNALFRCFRSIHEIIKINLDKPTERDTYLNGALFTGRRTGGFMFILLQNLMVKQCYKYIQPGKPYLGCIGTSSTDAWWLLKRWGVCTGTDELNPVGTHAHELSMGLSALFPQLDQTLPLTQILGHYLYWKYCSVRQGVSLKIPMLPDTLGTPAFLLAATVIKFPDSTKSFLETCIGSARQDSGTLAGFVEIMDAFNCKVPIMASEISTNKDIHSALVLQSSLDNRFPYATFGAGGYFGDSPKVWNDIEFYMSVAVKIVRCFILNNSNQITNETHPIKLGDIVMEKIGDIVKEKPGKISIDNTLTEPARVRVIQSAIAIRDKSYKYKDDKIIFFNSKEQNDLFKKFIEDNHF